MTGLLSQGVRIAPPEAPVTGYFLGKGAYFADCVTTSAQVISDSPLLPFFLIPDFSTAVPPRSSPLVSS